MRHLRYLGLAFAVSACSAGAPPYAAHTATYGALHATSSYAVVHSFQGPPNDGWVAVRGLVENAGLLYGTTSYGGSASKKKCGKNGCGTFYAFDPSSSQETVLYSFQGGPNDGALPNAHLIYANGTFYGASWVGGSAGFGTIFALVPPKGKHGRWTDKVLYNFAGPPNDGNEPTQLIAGPRGTLYGTTFFGGNGTGCIFKSEGCGTVFELSPPGSGSGSWHERTLHSFSGAPDGAAPVDSLVLSRSGALFGETAYGGVSGECPYLGGGCGTIFVLRPRGGSQWSLQIIHSFNVAGGKPQHDGVYPISLVLGTDGTLYGLTVWGGGQPGCDLEKGVNGCGTLFSVKQRSPGRWVESILYAFKGGQNDGANPSDITPDGDRGFFALTGVGGTGPCQASTGCGTLLELTPPMRRAIGWSDRILHSFEGPPTDGDGPGGTLVFNNGAIYGTTGYGGAGPCNFGCGTIYEFTP
jgi:uncharacterized repeat protein (TIGR03803 family)